MKKISSGRSAPGISGRKKGADTISLSLPNFVGSIVDFLSVCTIRLVVSSLPPRYPLKAEWSEFFPPCTGHSSSSFLLECGVQLISLHPAFCKLHFIPTDYTRSEERRVGKECRSRWS